MAAEAYPAFLTAAGLCPEPCRCHLCGARVGDSGALDPQAGGVVCERCAGPTRAFAVELLSTRAWGRLSAEREAAALEASVIAWVETHVGRSLRTARVWSQHEVA